MSKTDLKTPWYPVPGNRGAKRWEGDPHILNCDGELVGVFETLADAEAAARAVNERRTPQGEDKMQEKCTLLIERVAEVGRHYTTLSVAYQPDVRAQEYQLHGIQLLCELFGWHDLATKAGRYSDELNSARARMTRGAKS